MAVRVMGGLMKHLDDIQLRAVLHSPDPPQSGLTLFPRYMRVFTSHHSTNILQTPILPCICNSLLSAQTILSCLLPLVILIQFLWFCQSHFPSSLGKTKDWHRCSHNTLHTVSPTSSEFKFWVWCASGNGAPSPNLNHTRNAMHHDNIVVFL